MANRYWRKFGCEFEFSTSFKDMESIVQNAVYSAYGYNKVQIVDAYPESTSKTKWILKKDQSTGSELTTPISKYSDFPHIKDVINHIASKDVKITKSDSVHIHVQADDVPRNNIIAAWLQIEPAIRKCYPNHRQKNKYCEKVMKWNRRNCKDLSPFFKKAKSTSEYHNSAMSLFHYDEWKTVEFRMGEGSVNPSAIKMFVGFYMMFLNYAAEIDPVDVLYDDANNYEIDYVLDMIGIKNASMVKFFNQRYKEFGAYL